MLADTLSSYYSDRLHDRRPAFDATVLAFANSRRFATARVAVAHTSDAGARSFVYIYPLATATYNRVCVVESTVQ